MVKGGLCPWVDHCWLWSNKGDAWGWQFHSDCLRMRERTEDEGSDIGDLLYWSCEVAVESVMTGQTPTNQRLSLEWIRLA